MKFLDSILIKVFMFLRSSFGFRPHNRVNKIHQIEEFLYVVVQGCLGGAEFNSNILLTNVTYSSHQNTVSDLQGVELLE